MTAQPAATFNPSSRPFGAPIGMATPAAVSFQGLTKRYGPTTALDDVSLDVPLGSTVALLGPNGAGKSTAINLFLGLLRPDSGDVQWCWLDLRYQRGNGHLHSTRRPGPGSELPGCHDHRQCRSQRARVGGQHGDHCRRR